MIHRIEASGIDALGLVTELLHRVRLADPSAGVLEAADFQWWWRTPRRSDELPQSFWMDGPSPVAAVMLTDWTRHWGLDPIVMPDLPAAPGGASEPDRAADLLAEMLDLGLAALRLLPPGPVETLVRDDDDVLQRLLGERGFTASGEHGASTWLDEAQRPPPPAIPDGFELVDRSMPDNGPHPMARRSGPDVESRLRATSLYDPALDLALRSASGEIAAYALFWFDPVTRVGMLEPMRTEDPWQRRGLGHALVLNGLARAAERGATRFKVSFVSEPAKALYLGAGFRLATTDTAWRLERAD